MASGIQYNAALAATTYTTIATGPASSSTAQVLTVSILNRASTSATITLAMCATGTVTPASTDYLLYQYTVGGNGVYEQKNIVLAYGYTLVGWSSTANFTFIVHGIEGQNNSVLIGRLGAQALSASTATSVFSGPASNRMATCTAQITNTGASPVNINLFISTTPTSPGSGDYLEYNYTLSSHGTLTRTGLVLSNGYSIGALASAAGVNVVVWGVDDTA
jgi:hypothetical protein